MAGLSNANEKGGMKDGMSASTPTNIVDLPDATAAGNKVRATSLSTPVPSLRAILSSPPFNHRFTSSLQLRLVFYVDLTLLCRRRRSWPLLQARSRWTWRFPGTPLMS